MADIPQWQLKGDWFDVCSCNIPCPCEFAQPPTNNICYGVLAYHIREGHYGDVPLAGLNLVLVGTFEGNLWAGQATGFKLGLFLDARANAQQQEALQTIFSGHAGEGSPRSYRPSGARQSCSGWRWCPLRSKWPMISPSGGPRCPARW
jgi:hypothetical protein